MMSPICCGSGSNICRRSMWANSAATRPRLSQTPRRIVSISAGDFSGKAAARLARPILCSFSLGPSMRMKLPAKSAMCLRLVARIVRSIPTASDPSAVSTPALTCRRTRWARAPNFVIGDARGGSSKGDDDLSEHLPAFDPRQPALEVGERNLGVDHRQQTVRHLGEALADVAHRSAERADDAVLLLEQLHQVDGRRWPRGRAASDQPSAALEAKERAVEGLRAHMLEYHVDALFGRDLAHGAFEALGAIIDHVIGAQRLGLFRFGIVADRGDDGAADRLRHLDGDGADAGTAGMHEHALARLELGIVEQHVLHRCKGDGRAGGVAQGDPFGNRQHQTCRHIDEIAGEAVEVKAHDAADVFTQIVAALPAGLAGAAGQGAVHDDAITRLEGGYIRTDCGNLARGLDAHHDRQLAPREGHAAIAPEVEVVERHRADLDLHLARRRGRGRRKVGKLELAVRDQRECPHASRGLAAHHQRDVLAAEAERVRQRMTDLGIARGVRHDIERYGRVGDVVVDRRRQALMLEREQCEYGLDRAGRRQRVPDHRLVRGNRYRPRPLAEYRRYAEIFHLVVLGRSGAMRIDVVDIVGSKPGVRDGVTDAADDGLAVGAGAGAVERIRHLAAAGEHAENLRPACNGGLVILEHEGRGSLRHDKAVAVLGEWLGRRLRRVVCGRQRRQEREADQALRVDGAIGADAERSLGFATADRLDAELDRARPRRTGGRHRNRRALGPEALGEMLGHGSELAAFVNGMEAARRARPQKIVVSYRVVGAGAGRQRVAVRPFDLDRSDGEEQWAGEVAFAADASLADRLLGDHRRHALAEFGRAERLDRHEIDAARDRGLEALVGKTGDAADAGFSGRELGPVVRLAGAERGNDAPAGDHHGRPPILARCHPSLLHVTASISAMPSPRQWPTAVTTTRSSGPSYSRSTPEGSTAGNNFLRPSASAASAIFMANCGSKPCPRMLPVARTGTSGRVVSQARSSPVAGCAPVAPEITAMSAGAGGGKSRCHIRASAAVIAPAGRLERSDNTPDSRASGLALRASAWPRASRTRNAPSEPSTMPFARSQTG